MNSDAKIKVRTALGETEIRETGDNVAQGTVEGATVSSANVDKGINYTFANSYKEISYGEERIQPLMYQDDVIRAADSIESLEYGNALIDHVMREKVLDLNTGKSKFMIIGSNKVTEEMRAEIASKSIILADTKISASETEKYLGDYFHKQSVIETVKRRYRKAIEAIGDIKSIIEDIRAEKIGAIMTGLEIFNLSVIPYILYNSETWDQIPKEAMKLLEKVQMTFLRTLLKTPISTPKASLLWETGCLSINAMIVIRKLNFYFHIKTLHKDTLARQIADIQVNNNFPGFMKEINKIIREYDLVDTEVEDHTKNSWKKIVSEQVFSHEKYELLLKLRKYRKINHKERVHEELEIRSYMKNMNLQKARMKFSLETQ